MKPAIFILPLGILLSACDNPSNAPSSPVHTTAEQDADFLRMASAGKMLPDLQAYLDSRDPVPRTFAFDRLNFDPGSPSIRPVDQQTIYALANALQRHSDVRVRIVGYDDGELTRNENAALGLQRAASIVLAVRKAGVKPSQIEAAAGRPVNGQRTAELIVLRK